MAIGLAILIAAVLFLIDRNHVWPQVWRGVKKTLKVTAILAGIGGVIWGLDIARDKWTAAQDARKQEAAQASAQLAACKTWEIAHPVGSAVDWVSQEPVYPPAGCTGSLELSYESKITSALIAPAPIDLSAGLVPKKNSTKLRATTPVELTTQEYGSLKCGEVQVGDIVTLLEEHGGDVRIMTANGHTGWAGAYAFEVVR